MVTKDIFTIALAGAAFAFSIASFVLTFRQRTVEDKRNIRKSLTDVVAELTKVNIAFNQLDLDHPNSTSRPIVNFRRNYNAQRRYLANHGEFLSNQIPELSTDIDYVALAGAFDASGDYVRAQKFYELGVSKSPTDMLRMWNLRALARFWFNQGNATRGRKTYEESLQLQVPDSDAARQAKADTHLIWASLEEEHGYKKEAQSLREGARVAAERIGNRMMRENMLRLIGEVASEANPDLPKPV
jgi:tetratricopeptide (TPR) repeat protein